MKKGIIISCCSIISCFITFVLICVSVIMNDPDWKALCKLSEQR